jgi:putative DNA primase/helicase
MYQGSRSTLPNVDARGGRVSTGSGTRSKARLRLIEGGKNKGTKEEAAVDRVVRTYALTDTGNTERLVEEFGDRLRFVPSWKEFIIYTGTHWRRDVAEIQVGKFAKKIAVSIGLGKQDEHVENGERKELDKWRKKSGSKGKRQAMMDLLKHEEARGWDVAVDHEMLDTDRWALNVANGTLDLRTGALRPHSPLDLIMKYIPIAYNKNARAPRWSRFLREVLPDADVRAFVHRFLGYCLTGDVSERMFVIFLGGGCNGKTAFLNAVEAVLGEYATTAAPSLLVAKENESHPTEIADLFGARLAVTSETRKGATFDEERVKKLTGSDRLKARRMREDFWHFDPTHKLLIASNHKPRVKDASDSFWDRVAIVPFLVRIPKHKIDRALGEKLKEEREGILAWLVEGCRLWREKKLTPPAAVMAATKEYRTDEDIVGNFFDECCVVDKNVFTFTSEIMRVNKAWAEALHLYPISPKELAEKLRSEGCVQSKKNGNMGWRGIKVTKKVKFK